MWEFNGKQFTNEQLQLAADKANLSFDELVSKLREKGLTEVKVDRIGDDKKEETGFFEEIGTSFERLKSGSAGALSRIAQIPAQINRAKFAFRMERLPDDNPLKEYYNSLEGEKQDEFLQKYEKIMAGGLPGASTGISAFGESGLEVSEDLKEYQQEINSKLPQYDRALSEAYIAAAKGDISAVPEVIARTISGSAEGLPSLLQAMIPYVGIPSIILGSAAEASTDAIEEGKKVDIDNLAYSSFVGLAEGALETVTRGIGKSLFNNLKGQGIAVVERKLKDIFLRIGKDYGKEGLSEGTSAALSKAAKAVYIGDAEGFDEIFNSVFDDYEVLDNILIGGALGGKTRGVGELAIARNNRSINKTLDNTNVNDVNSAFQNDNVNEDVINIARNKNASARLDAELKQKVDNGEITVERRDEIKKNFSDTQSAVTLADNLNIGKDLIQETVTLLKERNALAGKIELAGANKAIVDAEINRLKEVDARLVKISSDNQLNLTTEKVTDIVSGLDKINIEIAENQDAADKIAKDKNLEKKASSQQGFILQDLESGEQTIVINKEIAAEDAAVNVAAHELLHGVLFNTVGKNPEAAEVLSEALKVEINKIDTDILKDSDFKTRLDAYKNDPTAIQAEETLTLFADAVANGEIKYNETVFTKIGDIVRRILQQAGLSDIKFNNSRDVFNFIKDYNNSIVKGQLTKAQTKLTQEAATGALISDTQADQTTQIRESKGALDAINNIIPSNIKTKEQFQSDPKVFGDAFRATEPNGVISNYVKSRSTSVEQANATIRNIQDRLINFDPAFNKTFGEFVFANTNFAKLDANKELAIESARKARETRIDQSTKQIADTQTETPTTQTRVSRKLNVLKLDKVNEADLVKAVKVKEGDTFKEVLNNNTGEIGSKIFNIPANKITDGTKNLTYAKKITDGIPENSEAGNIQEFFRVGQNADKFIKLLPEENVSETDADINELGENIDVDRNVSGLSIGMKGKVLNYFYNKTNRRSKGLTSQPTIWELKPEFRNPTVETINKLKDDLGITPPGELNNYNRDIGQLLKGVAKTYAQQASLSSAQRVLEGQTKTAKDPAAVKKQTANITAAQKTRVVYSKKDASQTRFNEKVSGTVTKSRIQDAKDNNYKPGPKYTDAPKKIYDRNKKLPESVRSFDGETVLQGASRVINNFLARYPKHEQFLNKALTFGVDRSLFGVQELWNKNIIKRGSREQTSYKRTNYTSNRQLKQQFINETKKSGYVEAELKKLDDLIEFYKDFEAYAKDSKKDLWVLDEIAVAASDAQTSPLRSDAPVLIYEVEPGTKKPLFNVKGVEEHTQPQNQANGILRGGVNNGTLDKAIETAKATYMQGFISLTNNDLLDIKHKSKMPDLLYKAIDNGLKLDPGLLSVIRLTESDVDLNNIYYIPTKQTLSEYFFNDANIDLKIQKELMRDLFEGKSTLKQLRAYGKVNSKVTVNKPKVFNKNSNKTTVKYSKAKNNDKLINDLNNYDKALRNAKD
jgi:hypothetical protein